ncbi:acetylornithine/succinylornithine family transaminase [Ruminiclostridium cellulolyticum]|uniref:Aminotransferase class-III n=1 Tax=Ruminiclostridium cellulolyticum (strain ATCC 35319 / DSM 5812 / JCM 6584 / H10) TaxID=394503 RepID=B8I2H1_RUMCH|nr:acetylornithine/succinylornithine family transaminase [Ruminiclostridium cellulolyticum]ACL75964.1 aminotransferase class-III [Ruminiclostridium cellulolyticum H10]
MSSDCYINSTELIKKAEKSLMYVTNRPDVVFIKGKGSYLWDSNSNKYLDMIAGWAVCCLGHSPEIMVDALTRQANLLINPSPSFYNEPAIEFANLLTKISCMDKVFFINSGAEANEGAIKLARKYGQKYMNGAFEIITAWNSFHGRTLATMAASGKKIWENLYQPRPQGFAKVEYNDIESLKQAISKDTCAIMLELVQGEGGVIAADKTYIKQVRQLCDENNILLIIDEVQTGLGRLGHMFAYEEYGIEPDIMTLAKGIGGGFPLSALLAKDKVCCFEAGDQGGTYSMTPLGAAVGKAVVEEIINSDLCNNAKKMGEYFTEQLCKLMDEHKVIKEIRGSGLLIAIGLHEEIANQIKDECMNNFLIINAPNTKTLRFMPALNISTVEVDEAISILNNVLNKVSTIS